MHTSSRTTARTAGVIVGILFSFACWAQSPGETRVAGAFGSPLPDFGDVTVTFTCTMANPAGSPCSGTYRSTQKNGGCSNTFYLSDAILITGLNITQPGPIQGNVVLTNFETNDGKNPDGTCFIKPGSIKDFAVSFTGTWNGSTAAITFATLVDDTGYPLTLTGSLSADKSSTPVFPMVVTASIADTATVTAVIQYRPQDVGTTGSLYVFAMAPTSVVKSAADGAAPFVIGKTISTGDGKADSVACVLAQLNSSGQLQAVSTSSLTAYITGVLSAQGQAVNMVNGVPTVNIGGATFYVGYGTSSTAMINSGINRSAITVPGARECRPQAPQSGWWWNPAESGRGFSIESSGNNLFMAAYLYDVSGRSTWHVAAGPTSLDGSVFNSQLLSFGNGVTLNGPYRPNSALPSAGPISLTFDDAQHGTLVWPGGSVAIQRFPFSAAGVNATPLANQPESGWWWGGGADNGRGFFIEWQGNAAFVAGYMYDTTGNATWYVAANDAPMANPRSFQGTWLQLANGQTLTGAYRPPSAPTSVAPVTIQFQGADTAILTLPTGPLSLSRFRF